MALAMQDFRAVQLANWRLEEFTGRGHYSDCSSGWVGKTACRFSDPLPTVQSERLMRVYRKRREMEYNKDRQWNPIKRLTKLSTE